MSRKKKQKVCSCGCGEMTKGGHFCQGHDQKLRSTIIKKVGGGLNLYYIIEHGQMRT